MDRDRHQQSTRFRLDLHHGRTDLRLQEALACVRHSNGRGQFLGALTIEQREECRALAIRQGRCERRLWNRCSAVEHQRNALPLVAAAHVEDGLRLPIRRAHLRCHNGAVVTPRAQAVSEIAGQSFRRVLKRKKRFPPGIEALLLAATRVVAAPLDSHARPWIDPHRQVGIRAARRLADLDGRGQVSALRQPLSCLRRTFFTAKVVKGVAALQLQPLAQFCLGTSRGAADGDLADLEARVFAAGARYLRDQALKPNR